MKHKKNYPLAFFLAYLVPGLGHFYLGRKGKGFFLFFALLSLYGLGLSLGGGILWEEMNVLTVLSYGVKFFNGIPFLVTLFYQMFQDLAFDFSEVGTTLILVAGALNLLVMVGLMDAVREVKGQVAG